MSDSVDFKRLEQLLASNDDKIVEDVRRRQRNNSTAFAKLTKYGYLATSELLEGSFVQFSLEKRLPANRDDAKPRLIVGEMGDGGVLVVKSDSKLVGVTTQKLVLGSWLKSGNNEANGYLSGIIMPGTQLGYHSLLGDDLRPETFGGAFMTSLMVDGMSANLRK